MKDLWELFEKLISAFSLPVTGWSVALFLLLFLLRARIQVLCDRILDWIGATFGGRWSFERFDPKYRTYIRERHLHMKVVGVRTEAERRPSITEAYVPILVGPEGDRIESAVSVENIIRDNNHCLILGDPGAGKSTILDHLIVDLTHPERRVTLWPKVVS